MIKESFQYTIQLQLMILKPTCNKEAIFLINVNRQAIKHKIRWDTKMDCQYMQTDNVCTSKRAIKEKPTLGTKSLENKKVSKNQ